MSPPLIFPPDWGACFSVSIANGLWRYFSLSLVARSWLLPSRCVGEGSTPYLPLSVVQLSFQCFSSSVLPASRWSFRMCSLLWPVKALCRSELPPFKPSSCVLSLFLFAINEYFLPRTLPPSPISTFTRSLSWNLTFYMPPPF